MYTGSRIRFDSLLAGPTFVHKMSHKTINVESFLFCWHIKGLTMVLIHRRRTKNEMLTTSHDVVSYKINQPSAPMLLQGRDTRKRNRTTEECAVSDCRGWMIMKGSSLSFDQWRPPRLWWPDQLQSKQWGSLQHWRKCSRDSGPVRKLGYFLSNDFGKAHIILLPTDRLEEQTCCL